MPLSLRLKATTDHQPLAVPVITHMELERHPQFAIKAVTRARMVPMSKAITKRLRIVQITTTFPRLVITIHTQDRRGREQETILLVRITMGEEVQFIPDLEEDSTTSTEVEIRLMSPKEDNYNHLFK